MGSRCQMRVRQVRPHIHLGNNDASTACITVNHGNRPTDRFLFLISFVVVRKMVFHVIVTVLADWVMNVS